MEERKLCPLRYYANFVSTTLTVLILHKVESVYFFYSNPVYIYIFLFIYLFIYLFSEIFSGLPEIKSNELGKQNLSGFNELVPAADSISLTSQNVCSYILVH